MKSHVFRCFYECDASKNLITILITLRYSKINRPLGENHASRSAQTLIARELGQVDQKPSIVE